MSNPVPAAVEQLRENMLDPSGKPHVKFNYYQTMRNVKEYAERACAEYDRKQKRR